MFGEGDNLKKISKNTKDAFDKVKEDINMHTDSINQLDSEIQSFYDHLDEMKEEIKEELREELKEEFNSKMADLMMQIKLNSNINESWIYSVQEEKVFNTIELPIREQEVFLIIYSESNAVSSKEIGRRLGFSDEMVNRYIYNMISKGVPLLIQHKDDEILVSMELKFKDLQAKKNILKIDESISKQLLSDKII